MACNCNCTECDCCRRFLKSTSVAITGTAPNQVVTVTIPSTQLRNLETYCFVIAQSLPNGSDSLPIVVSNGTDTLTVMCMKGNTVRADQIRTRKRYRVIYGDDPMHLMITNCLTSSCFSVCPTTEFAESSTAKKAK